MTSELDLDTALERGPEGWQGVVTDRWHVGAGANGGYIAALLLRAQMNESPFLWPLTMTTHYLSGPAVGPVAIRVMAERVGRSHATLSARLEQGSRPVAVSLTTFTKGRSQGPLLLAESMPVVVPPEECAQARFSERPGLSLRERFDYRTALPDGETGGWLRLRDRALDALAVPLFLDCWPPAIAAQFPGAIAPTLELTVHWRAEPSSAWHLARFRSRFLVAGYVEEDGELWDEDGRLVAQSRQLALFRP